jgi:hypothetical protein
VSHRYVRRVVVLLPLRNLNARFVLAISCLLDFVATVEQIRYVRGCILVVRGVAAPLWSIIRLDWGSLWIENIIVLSDAPVFVH